MNLKNYVVNFFIIITLSLFITGCNATEDIADDSSKEAEVERGLMALDKENYDSAAEIFESLKKKYPSDNSLKTYHSNALAGSAGLDTYRLMKTIDRLNDENSDDSIEIAGRTLTGAEQGSDPVLTTEEIADKTDKFEKAMTSILEIAGTDYDSLTGSKAPASRSIQAVSLEDLDLSKFTDDELIQLGLMSFNHVVLVISDILTEVAGSDNIILTKDGFITLYNNNITTADIDILLSKLSLDMEFINNAVTAIENFLDIQAGETNDISEEFEKFRNELDQNNDKTITENELETYLNNL
jgi:hypothetical protein